MSSDWKFTAPLALPLLLITSLLSTMTGPNMQRSRQWWTQWNGETNVVGRREEEGSRGGRNVVLLRGLGGREKDNYVID